MSADLDLFHVCMKDGSVRQMNAEQIDEAFHSGLIDGKCGVVRAGELEWTTLGVLAGLDDVTPSPSSVAPLAMDASGDVPAFRPRRGRKIAGAFVALALIAGIGFAATKARPGFVTTSLTKLKSLRTTMGTTTAEAPKAAAVVVAPPPPAPAPPPPAKLDPPKPEAKPAPSASVNVPTFNPHDLPAAKTKSRRR